MATVPIRLRKLGWLAALVLAVLAPGAASADTFSFDLSAGNSAISGFTGPYAHVTITTTSSTTANVTFSSLTNSGKIYLMGGAQAVDLNVNAASFSVGTITESNSGTGFQMLPPPTLGSGNADGWGSFNLTVNNFDGFGHSADNVSFTLTNTGGTWANAASVLAANGNGAIAAAHIFVTTSPANASNSALATGYAAAGSSGGPPPINTPEPAGLALALSGVVGFGLAGVRRFRRRAVP
jgi:hypothetical protein